jgi:hypothetical protein
MLRKILALTSICVLATAAWADDPWRTKAYSDWTMADVHQILDSSPWVHTTNVDAPWIKGNVTYLQVLDTGCDGRPDMSKPMSSPPQWQVGPATVSIVGFQITWESSHTFRSAKMKFAVLCGRTSEESAQDLLSQEVDDYMVGIRSPDMSPFDGMDESALTQSCTLNPKKSGRKMNPSEVTITRGADRKSVFQLTLKFPRKNNNGEPTISSDEKEVEIGCQAGKISVKTKFQPPKMLNKEGVDL